MPRLRFLLPIESAVISSDDSGFGDFLEKIDDNEVVLVSLLMALSLSAGAIVDESTKKVQKRKKKKEKKTDDSGGDDGRCK
jgi:hypothetical protein